MIKDSSCIPKSVSVKSARSVWTDTEEEEAPDEYVTATSPTFLLAIFCWDCPAAAIYTFVGVTPSGSATRAYIVSLWAV